MSEKNADNPELFDQSELNPLLKPHLTKNMWEVLQKRRERKKRVKIENNTEKEVKLVYNLQKYCTKLQ
jgi:hypothetical protein